MAAITYPLADPWVVRRRSRPDAWTYRRRRAVVLLTLLASALVAAASIRFVLAGSGGGALTTSGSAGAAALTRSIPTPNDRVYVVRQGDTLWSIVVATGRYGDPRSEVDRLSVQLDGRPLQAGQRLLIP